MNATYLPSDYLPIFIQLALALGFIVVTMIVTHSIGPKRHSEKKDDPFECGIPAKGDARTPISIKYFLIAILFVLFDVEVIVPVGGKLQGVRNDRFCRDDSLYGTAAGGILLHHPQGRFKVGISNEGAGLFVNKQTHDNSTNGSRY